MNKDEIVVGQVFKDTDRRGPSHPYFTVLEIRSEDQKAYGKRTVEIDGDESKGPDSRKVRVSISLNRLTSYCYKLVKSPAVNTEAVAATEFAQEATAA